MMLKVLCQQGNMINYALTNELLNTQRKLRLNKRRGSKSTGRGASRVFFVLTD